MSRDSPPGSNSGLETVGDEQKNRSVEQTSDEERATGIVAETSDESVEPTEFVDSVVETALTNPVAAGDAIGDLLAIVRDCDEDARVAAKEALDLMGLLRPVEFEVWIGDIVQFASADRDELSFVGLRALAQLSAVRPAVAKNGLDAAISRLQAQHVPTRRAAIAVVGEVGEAFPEAVTQTDRQIMTAMRDANPSVRLAGVMTAGKLLGAEPNQFPRTVSTLPETLDDDDEEVWEYAHAALIHFVREHPSQVPEKRHVIERLATVSDEELSVREGATKDAMTTLLSYEPGFDL
ncbi:adaptin [Halogeometricum borinquense]|uniref:Adaptin n=1 Tax=Halogeometricum borinquense TaxID=60847 RepID=A0A6C0UCH0_9EURY|nr:adaptin [Halogeometricum borinquense]QIB73002.1 adaptin [Halogeometricum borinquense]QIQ77630.1 adaptin [Halogeometricum borinquense]